MTRSATRRPAARAAVFVAGLAALAPSMPIAAATLEFDVSFSDSTYAVAASDTVADLVAAHLDGGNLETTPTASFTGIDTATFRGNQTRDYSIMMTATFSIGVPGTYAFEVGADWGRGGGVALFDADTDTLVSETVTAEDIWWSNTWQNSDVLATDFELTEGLWRVVWVGFEDCCAGATSVRFAFEGGAFSSFDATNFVPQTVPVPPAIWMLAGAAAGLGVVGRRRGPG